MPRAVTLFSGYSGRENRTTNYCLLVLRLLYEENPKFLSQVFSGLFGEEVGADIGVLFSQQERKNASVPDGLIIQAPVTIYIETKNYDWFRHGQLAAHLDSLLSENPGRNVLLALSNFEKQEDARFPEIEALCRKRRYRGKVMFKSASFNDLLDSMRLDHLPKNLVDTIADFRAYLDEEGLLASWHNWLDAVNCGRTIDEVLEHRAYLCPASGGPYTHGRCRYFGVYSGKTVRAVAEIEAVVDVLDRTHSRVLWNNRDEVDADLKERARQIARHLRPREYPLRTFLLGELHETEFVKDTPGGMYGSKRYFNVSPLGANDAKGVAERLRGKTWSQLQLEATA